MSKKLVIAMSRVIVTGAVSMAFLLAGVAAQAGVAEIKTLYQEINALIQSKTAKQVSLYAAGQQDRVEWRTVVGRADQDEFSKSDFRAQVYLQENKILKAQIETTSASGDWKLTEEYYFYKNDRTAFYFRSLVTFQGYDYEHDRELPQGPYVVEERRYYNEAGKEIRHLEKAFVQATKQEIPVKYIRANLPIEFYQDTKSLPFYRAISRRDKGG